MIWVKPITVGPDKLGPIDPDRRDRLKPDEWRAVPDSPYWRRMAHYRDVRLREVDPNPSAPVEPAIPTAVVKPAAASVTAPPAQADKPKVQE
jgi:hypothetical protein